MTQESNNSKAKDQNYVIIVEALGDVEDDAFKVREQKARTPDQDPKVRD